MKLYLSITFFLLFMVNSMVAQEDFGDNQDNPDSPAALVFDGFVYWGGSLAGTEYQTDVDSFLQGISDRLVVMSEDGLDSFRVISFNLIYKEVGVYENGEGKSELMTDSKMKQMPSDTIDWAWKQAFRQRLAWGDTIILDDVMYQKNNMHHLAHPLVIYFRRPNSRSSRQ